MGRIIKLTILLLQINIFILFTNCTSYFAKTEFLDSPPELIAQNSRMALIISNDDKLKIVARLTYLNNIDISVYSNREYFFLEIFNDDENIIVPDSMQITMLNKKPLWIRSVEEIELDDILFLNNSLSSGFLIAFKTPSVFERKTMKIQLKIDTFKPSIFDFSYITLETKL